MSDPVWYRSLYWRIAFGFLALLAILLLVQGVLFLWLTDRFVGSSPRTPQQLAEVVADTLGTELAAHPEIDIGSFLQERFRRVYQPFVVVMRDGRRASNRPSALPPDLWRWAQGRLRGMSGPQEEFPRRPGTRTMAVFAPVVVAGTVDGMVAVPSNPPPMWVMLRELWPTLVWFGLGLLGVGAVVTALLIFRPAHKRLRTLEQAARALGEGRTDVRAAEGGGDEVSSLAHTFNRMADDLQSRANALAAADRARRQLLADVSHELMTPLSAIRGYVETLAMPEVVLDQATRQRYLRIVEQETHKLEEIIGDLLDLAKLEGGGDTLNIERVSAAELFGRVADRHGRDVREQGLTLETEVAADTPPIRGDAARLEQALQNVAANAIRHTPQAGRVTLSAEPYENGQVRITVADTGPGIPPEHLPHVFDRFYKVDAARAGTTVPSGSGLGLSIVQAIVERHGGRVRASNAPEGGAVFEMLLPAAPELKLGHTSATSELTSAHQGSDGPP
jgi:signal transduction histidine kinase